MKDNKPFSGVDTDLQRKHERWWKHTWVCYLPIPLDFFTFINDCRMYYSICEHVSSILYIFLFQFFYGSIVLLVLWLMFLLFSWCFRCTWSRIIFWRLRMYKEKFCTLWNYQRFVTLFWFFFLLFMI